MGSIPDTVDDFLRNFLQRLGLVRTLDSFQWEWYQNQDQRGFVPDPVTYQSLVQSALAQVRSEAGLLRDRVSELNQTLVSLQQDRDFHRDRCSKVEAQKGALWEDLTRLKDHRRRQDSALSGLQRDYETALRTRTLTQARTVLYRRNYSFNLTWLDVFLQNVPVPQTEFSRRERRRRQRSDEPRAKEPHVRIRTKCRERPGPNVDQDETENEPKPKDQSEGRRRIRGKTNLEETHSTGPAHFALTCPIRAHHQPVSDMAVHPIRRLLASSSDDRTWRLWALPSRREKVGALLLSGQGHSYWLTSCSFSPDGERLATTSGDSTVGVWDLGRGLRLLSLCGHLSATWGCSFSGSGCSLASASSDRTVRLWDPTTGRALTALRRHGNTVTSVHFLPRSDHLLLSSSRDHTLLLWDDRVSACTATIRGHEHPVEHCSTHTTGRVLASCDSGGVVKLWDVRRPCSELVSAHTSPAGANQVNLSPAGSAGEEVAVAGGDGRVLLLQASSGHVTEVGEHQGQVCSVCFDHQGATLLSAGADGAIRVWSRSDTSLEQE